MIRSVAMVSPYNLSSPGGVQEQVMGLADEMGTRGWSVTVGAPGPSEPWVDKSWQHRSLGRSRRISANGSVAPIGLNVPAANAFAKFCDAENIDVVHIHEPLAPMASWALLRRNDIPVVATFHRSGVDVLASAGGLILGRYLKRIAASAAVSEAAARTARDTVGLRPEILWNGLDLHLFDGIEPWPTSGPTILFLGRDEPRKGRKVLLEAARHLDSSITLWVTGVSDGEAERPGAKVEFLGQISNEEKRRRLLGAQVFCAPSLGGESFGLVLAEGLLSGSIVVASDIDGYRQVLGDLGVLVAPGDVGALSGALARACSQGPREGKQRVAEFLSAYSLESLAQRYESLYLSLLDEKPSGHGVAFGYG